MASQHLSVRLSPETVSRLDSESHRTGQTRSQIAKTLLDEGLRMEHHPGITFRSGPAGRRAALFNGPDVWEVVRVIKQLDETGDALIQQTASIASIHEEAVMVALRYYGEFEGEIDRWIKRAENEEAEAEARYEREQRLLQR